MLPDPGLLLIPPGTYFNMHLLRARTFAYILVASVSPPDKLEMQHLSFTQTYQN